MEEMKSQGEPVREAGKHNDIDKGRLCRNRPVRAGSNLITMKVFSSGVRGIYSEETCQKC